MRREDGHESRAAKYVKIDGHGLFERTLLELARGECGYHETSIKIANNPIEDSSWISPGHNFRALPLDELVH
jgi:hypothetical protein